MLIDYSESGAVKIDMTAYIRKILEEMLEDMDDTATQPAAAYLFTIKEGIEELDEEQKEFFHATVAKLLLTWSRLSGTTL
jgi:hypothetical protein